MLFTLLVQLTFAQDVEIASHSSPVSGCELTTSEKITVTIINKTSIPVAGGDAIANYTVNGGPTVSEPLAGIGGNASYTFTFFQEVDLSACDQDFNIVVWIDYPIDINPGDNSISWTVRNDCSVVPGQIEFDSTVCKTSNTGTLNLTGWLHGTITGWTFSEDGGSVWSSITGTVGATSYTYNDLDTTTSFIIEYDGGYCGLFYSPITTITVQPPPDPGTLSGPDSLCISSASGTVTLSGNAAPVLDWESSLDGTTWTSIGNTTTTESFTSLTQTTMYRAHIDGGVCSDSYSDTLTVVISALSDAGTLNSDTTFCGSGSLDLVLSSFTGGISNWQFSNDGISWTSTSNINSNDTLNTGVLTNSTYYRTIVKNGVCPNDTSNQVFIDVQPQLNVGSISGGGSFCETNANGTITLVGNSGSIIKWEQSTDSGTTWTDIPNTTSTEPFSGLSQTTWYRVLIDGGACADEYTDTAIVIVSPTTIAGVLSADATICQGGSDSLYITGNTGAVVTWEESDDNITWTSLNTNDSSYVINSAQSSTYYRVIVKSDGCNEDTTNTVFVDVIPNPVADAGSNVSVMPGDSVQLQGSGGFTGIWMPGSTLSDSTVYDPYAFPSETTTYTLYVISPEGCLGTDNVTVAIGGALSLLDIKNVITANDDGFNDSWIIEGAEFFPSMKVEVYNIYGYQVYQNEDYKNDWKGEFKGKTLPDGTYLYVVMPGGTDAVLKGNLTILGGHD